jgi:hypothetical protein
MVWRSLALLVMYGHVEMGVGIAVKFADLGLRNISFAPVRTALCAESYHSCRPMYCTVALFLAYGRFLLPW